MYRSLTFLGLVASVGLLIAVFVFALKNPQLFIDGEANNYSELSAKSSADLISSGAKISGAVVSSQETQVREAAKIQDVELDALEKEQWLQQIDASIVDNVPLDDVLEFAPEKPMEKVRSKLDTENVSERFDDNNISSEVEGKDEETQSVEDTLKELNNMSFVDIRFKFGQMTLSRQAYEKIQLVADILKENPSIRAKINNYTDSFGDDNFNLELSRQRANTVYKVFLDKGVNLKQLSFEGLGESNPVTSNATLAGRKKNRRTEIQFFEAN